MLPGPPNQGAPAPHMNPAFFNSPGPQGPPQVGPPTSYGGAPPGARVRSHLYSNAVYIGRCSFI